MITLHMTNILDSAGSGRDLARIVAAHLRKAEAVALDMKHVQFLTPSFANAFVMTLAEDVGADAVSASLHVLNNPHAVQRIEKALARFQSGSRLSDQTAIEKV